MVGYFSVISSRYNPHGAKFSELSHEVYKTVFHQSAKWETMKLKSFTGRQAKLILGDLSGLLSQPNQTTPLLFKSKRNISRSVTTAAIFSTDCCYSGSMIPYRRRVADLYWLLFIVLSSRRLVGNNRHTFARSSTIRPDSVYLYLADVDIVNGREQ